MSILYRRRVENVSGASALMSGIVRRISDIPTLGIILPTLGIRLTDTDLGYLLCVGDCKLAHSSIWLTLTNHLGYPRRRYGVAYPLF